MIRRVLVLAALVFWEGGFSFYGAVVVPVLRSQLPPKESAPITRQVTNVLNATGTVVLLLLTWDLSATQEPLARRRRWRWLLWGLMALAQGVLFWLHAELDAMMSGEDRPLAADNSFRLTHRLYLLVCTVQWAGCVGFGILT